MNTQRDELIERLCSSAKASLNFAGSIPVTVRAISLCWNIETDPNAPDGRLGINVVWHTYFDAAPSEADIEYANSCSDTMISDIWMRLIWVEHKNTVWKSNDPDKIESCGIWLFQKSD